MGRRPCCDKLGVKKGPWSAEEDKKLISFILTKGHCCWRAVPKLAGLLRCGKSCRLRWTNYLRPDLKRGLLSPAEEQLVIDLHARLGNRNSHLFLCFSCVLRHHILQRSISGYRSSSDHCSLLLRFKLTTSMLHDNYLNLTPCRWSKIAAMLPGRTDNEIKNLWNTHIKKKLVKMGVDPVTHKPLDKQANSVSSQSTATTESKSDRPLQSRGTDGQIQSSENTSSPTETSSNTDGADPLLSCLWEDNTSLLDELWQFPSNEDVDYSSVEGQVLPWDEGSCEWMMLDDQALG
ncbi:hypothetical protein BHM03_00022065 [Ensete ventricosum]|nr:hypothetical protein BHM03_00022065 [Ensete ventricosum]